jgi:hypothetical protein
MMIGPDVAAGAAAPCGDAADAPLHALLAGGDEALAAAEYELTQLLVYGAATLRLRVDKEGFTERNTRMLSELGRAMKALRRTANKKAGKARETKSDESERGDDPAEILRELAARFERIRGDAGRGEASDPETGGP